MRERATGGPDSAGAAIRLTALWQGCATEDGAISAILDGKSPHLAVALFGARNQLRNVARAILKPDWLLRRAATGPA